MAVECDVLVVGAGPAGSVVSLVCAKNGFETVLIEKNSEVGGHTRTKLDATADGELTKIIKKLRLKTENEVYTSRWYSPSGNCFVLRSNSPEYFFKRGTDYDSFEVSTSNQAGEAGCKIFLGAEIEGIKKTGSGFDTVLLKTDSGKIRIKPKILVAADGGTSMFHSFVHKSSNYRKKIGYGCSGKFPIDADSSNIYFDAELLPGGYFYLITGRSGISSAGIVLDSFKTKKSAKYHFYKFLKRNKNVARKIKSPMNYFGGTGHIFDLDRHTYKNLVFVGDAAGLLDPFFGYGMTSAIVSGYHAGKYIKLAIDDNLSLLEGYDSKIREKFDRRLPFLYQRIFESLHNCDLDLIAEFLNKPNKRADIETILRQFSEM